MVNHIVNFPPSAWYWKRGTTPGIYTSRATDGFKFFVNIGTGNMYSYQVGGEETQIVMNSYGNCYSFVLTIKLPH